MFNDLQGIAVPLPIQKLIQSLKKRLFSDRIYSWFDTLYHFQALGCDLDTSLAALVHDWNDFHYDAMELSYSGHPFEFFPFGWQGGDALQYGHILHAPELGFQEYPAGSYSPADGIGVLWLGDATEEALANLIAVYIKYTPQANRSSVEELCRILDISIDIDNLLLGRGARAIDHQRILPIIPNGYHYEATSNGIGVLAPMQSFLDKALQPHDQHHQIEHILQYAEDMQKQDKHGTALWLLQQIYHESSPANSAQIAVCMAKSYAALGRDILVSRVEKYCEKHKNT